MYPLFHNLKVENFFTCPRCSVFVKHISFTKRIISLKNTAFHIKNNRFSVII